ncbi:molybdenum cofactor guanylyltransferase [Pontimicrobium aquaticum]|uniref:Probable molybdenum cofactor guanylyltransferase n=1 Tax=Pontimicrobium aquaticum TaxID=2565367 RepID=A0A4U0EW71_9FLAO|nr:molybdenum cofactor guanylyltransferase [Pontimicrobium aquaticum]TJY34652.1 molybdenum cofactor guanylyltransferase [Pontimicrobium aquaticum]
MIHKKSITGIILAGGKSSRMGTDKGTLLLNEKTFIQHIIDAMNPLVNHIVIVSDNPNHDDFEIERIEDVIKDAGPLAGLYSGLQQSKTDYNLVVSCDVPLITTKILKQIIENYKEGLDVIQLESNQKTMPLIALYNKTCKQTIKQLLDKGERRVRFAVSQLKTKTIMLDDNLSSALININTKEEFDAITN